LLSIANAATLIQHGWLTNWPSNQAIGTCPARTSEPVTITLVVRTETLNSSTNGALETHAFFRKYV
jgi:hypothetical protein